jgi:hypothetical protein
VYQRECTARFFYEKQSNYILILLEAKRVPHRLELNNITITLAAAIDNLRHMQLEKCVRQVIPRNV